MMAMSTLFQKIDCLMIVLRKVPSSHCFGLLVRFTNWLFVRPKGQLISLSDLNLFFSLDCFFALLCCWFLSRSVPHWLIEYYLLAAAVRLAPVMDVETPYQINQTVYQCVCVLWLYRCSCRQRSRVVRYSGKQRGYQSILFDLDFPLFYIYFFFSFSIADVATRPSCNTVYIKYIFIYKKWLGYVGYIEKGGLALPSSFRLDGQSAPYPPPPASMAHR